jgi:hypothetical protein
MADFPQWDLSETSHWMEKVDRLTKLLANLANNWTGGPSSQHNSDQNNPIDKPNFR